MSYTTFISFYESGESRFFSSVKSYTENSRLKSIITKYCVKIQQAKRKFQKK